MHELAGNEGRSDGVGRTKELTVCWCTVGSLVEHSVWTTGVGEFTFVRFAFPRRSEEIVLL